jgi:hypothetical protein
MTDEPESTWSSLGAAAERAVSAVTAFTVAVRAGEAQDERELLTFHPDVIDLDLKDAVWNPEP